MIGRMKYWMLISAGLRRKPVRTFLTGFAVVVSFLLFGVMHGVLAGFDDALDTLSETRLRVINRASMIAALPVAHTQSPRFWRRRQRGVRARFGPRPASSWPMAS